MPTKIESIKLVGTQYDGRAKLTTDQREAVKVLAREGYSQRKLATMFNVSRRLIQAIISPPARKPEKKHSKEYWSEIKQKHRLRKKALYREGKIGFTKTRAK